MEMGKPHHLEGESKIIDKVFPLEAHTQNKTQRILENPVSYKITRVSLRKIKCTIQEGDTLYL